MKKTWLVTILLIGASAVLPAQKLTILVPNGGDTLVNGTPMLITWSHAKLEGDETVLIALEGSADFGPIAYSKVSAGSLEWLAGQKMDGSFAKPAGGYKIIIECVDSESAYDLSDQPFTLAAPAAIVALMTPNGGETLEKGKDYDIRWSCAGQAGFVTLSLFQDEQPLGAIAENLPAASLSYRWRIGPPLVNGMGYNAGGNFRIQIQWRARAIVDMGKERLQVTGAQSQAAGIMQNNSDRSDNAFQIMEPAAVTGQKAKQEKEE
jgi:hypothetical protein